MQLTQSNTINYIQFIHKTRLRYNIKTDQFRFTGENLGKASEWFPYKQ